MLNKLALTFLLVFISDVSAVDAQINPGTGGKTGADLIAIKTDPVLRNPIEMVGIKTDPVLSDPKEMISIKTDPVLRQIDTLGVNATALFSLLSVLDKTGAKVSSQVVELKGITMLDVSMNGTPIASFVLQCDACEPIIYEY